MRTVLAALLTVLVLPLAACDSGNDAPLRIEATGDKSVEVYARRDTARLDVRTLFQAFDPATVSLALSADTAAHASLSGTTLSAAPINEGAYTVNVIARPQGGEQSSARITVQARADWCATPPAGTFDPLPYEAGRTLRFRQSSSSFVSGSYYSSRDSVTWKVQSRSCAYGGVLLRLTETTNSSTRSVAVTIPPHGPLPPIGRYVGFSEQMPRFFPINESGEGRVEINNSGFGYSVTTYISDARGLRSIANDFRVTGSSGGSSFTRVD